MTPRRPPTIGPTQSTLAARLRADTLVGLLGRLQRQASERGDRNAVAVLGAAILWLNTTSAIATTADRRLANYRCAHCHAEQALVGEVAELITRVRQVAP